MGKQNSDGGSRVLKVVEATAISPADAKAFIAKLRRQVARRRKGEGDADYEARTTGPVVDKVIARYSKLAATSGGLSALAGVIPGVGTIVAALGGGLADLGVCMKLQVDMCSCIAEAFGYDLQTEDGRHLAFLIAAGGTLEKAGVEVGASVASKAGVKMLRQYLKGAALQAIKAFFRKIGIVFARKALERAIPFGIGVLLGAGTNYAMTKYVGAQARRWFVLDRDMPDERAEEGAVAG